MKWREKQLQKHFALFVDKHRFPDFQVTSESWKAFKQLESYGHSAMTENDYILAAPWINAKEMWELTVKMIYEEMADHWSHGWGWYNVLRANITEAYWQGKGDRIYIGFCINLKNKIFKDGFIDTLMRYTGLTFEEKCRYLKLWEATNSKYLRKETLIDK